MVYINRLYTCIVKIELWWFVKNTIIGVFLSVCSELFHSDEVNPKVVLSWWFTVFWLSINNPVLGDYGGFFTPNNICLAILFVINHIMYMSGQFLADVLDGQLVHVCTQGTQIVFHTVCDQLANKASMFCFTVYL